MTIRIILADDHPIFRDGLVHSIDETGELKVVGIGGSADEAVALAAQHRPDVALLDLSMPGNGITARLCLSRCRHSSAGRPSRAGCCAGLVIAGFRLRKTRSW